MISSQVQGLGPLQSMFIQDHMLYSWKLSASEVGEVVRVLHQPEGTKLFVQWVLTLNV
ncbi:hypothetical protein MTR67_003509 [Solanum verrucosum]|uniref:Uncharacterized protein n=1 Tax=Solanum verrucosum TaxID=315347 RepID=A0AAF0PS60_SOLVR|nr:hypothetical protein MTR67_003509 [Solanum verrucosum]